MRSACKSHQQMHHTHDPNPVEFCRLAACQQELQAAQASLAEEASAAAALRTQFKAYQAAKAREVQGLAKRLTEQVGSRSTLGVARKPRLRGTETDAWQALSATLPAGVWPCWGQAAWIPDHTCAVLLPCQQVQCRTCSCLAASWLLLPSMHCSLAVT